MALARELEELRIPLGRADARSRPHKSPAVDDNSRSLCTSPRTPCEPGFRAGACMRVPPRRATSPAPFHRSFRERKRIRYGRLRRFPAWLPVSTPTREHRKQKIREWSAEGSRKARWEKSRTALPSWLRSRVRAAGGPKKLRWIDHRPPLPFPIAPWLGRPRLLATRRFGVAGAMLSAARAFLFPGRHVRHKGRTILPKFAYRDRAQNSV